MSETIGGSVPGGEGTAAAAPDSTPAADQSGLSGEQGAAQSASGDLGVAPGAAVDAALAAEQQTAPSEFVFSGRRFASQKHAEDFFRSQTGRVPDMQRKAAEQDRQIAELSSTVQALQRVLSAGPAAGPDQGQPQRGQAPAGAKSFADRLVESGDLQFITSLAEEKGLGHAIYALADIMGNELKTTTERLVEEHVQPIIQRGQKERIMGHAMGAFSSIGGEFPEFSRENQSPEAVEAQQAYVSLLKRVPPEEIARDPEFYALAAALMTRHQYGVPIGSTSPGTSGSPSALAAAAAEAQFQQGGPIDGSSARPRPAAAQPRTAEEQFEADIMGADDRLARDKTGKPLGWRRVS